MLRRSRSAPLAAALVVAVLQAVVAPVAAAASPTVTTGKDDYFANEVVDMYGAGFEAGQPYGVVVVRPDGSAVLYASSDDGQHGEQLCYDADASDGTDCYQTVTADNSGAWANLYQLNGVSGEYRINVYDAAGTLTATATFLDAASLRLTGTDGLPHTPMADAENLGTVQQTVPLSVTCPSGLTFGGTNFGTTETIDWSIAYFIGPTDDGPTLQPLTTFEPTGGTISAASPSACIGMTIDTSTLTVGQTYHGILVVTTAEAGGRSRQLKYHFRFTVDAPPRTPPETGAGTIGFWHNNNGQAIIKGDATTKKSCNATTWLRQFKPFQDLSSKATCTQVASYVSNVISNATGSPMNTMLKAQMLATALNVYFSTPGLGGNQIGAPVPIGGIVIDLTMICENSPCSSGYQDASGSFGGATSMTVIQMLVFQNSVANGGGGVWYGNNGSLQEDAKDSFDAINNESALTP